MGDSDLQCAKSRSHDRYRQPLALGYFFLAKKKFKQKLFLPELEQRYVPYISVLTCNPDFNIFKCKDNGRNSLKLIKTELVFKM